MLGVQPWAGPGPGHSHHLLWGALSPDPEGGSGGGQICERDLFGWGHLPPEPLHSCTVGCSRNPLTMGKSPGGARPYVPIFRSRTTQVLMPKRGRGPALLWGPGTPPPPPCAWEE